MSTSNYCLLLGSEKNRDRSLIGAARATGDPVAIMLPGGAVNAHRFADLIIPGNPNHAGQALAAVKAYQQRTGAVPNHVIPLTELSIEAGLAIAAAYDLPYLAAETVRIARDKTCMKEAFAAHHLPIPKFGGFTRFDELQRLVGEFGLPVVIKPINAGGSEGVRLVRGEQELQAAYDGLVDTLRGYHEAYGVAENAFQVEQFIDAEYEISFEILNTPAARFVLAVTDKYLGARPYFVELGHSMPSIWSRDERLRQTALAACEAIGLDRGLAHVELKVTAGGEPVLMEVNARPGGDLIPDLLQRISGLNPFEWHCRTFMQDSLPGFHPPALRGRAAVAFLKGRPGTVKAVRAPALSELPPEVVSLNLGLQAGDECRACIDSNTRDGVVEFYWPDDPADSLLTRHLEVAKHLSERSILVESESAPPKVAAV